MPQYCRRLECKKAINTHLLIQFCAGSYRFMVAQHTGKITVVPW